MVRIAPSVVISPGLRAGEGSRDRGEEEEDEEMDPAGTRMVGSLVLPDVLHKSRS
jgi:hypothetical protein